jgi:methionine sulfoxide reductase catalytic subunit
MIIKKMNHHKIVSSEITPEADYVSRRRFFGWAGTMVASATLAACAPKFSPTAEGAPVGEEPIILSGATMDELGNKATEYQYITHYNNYYEFTTDKEAVASWSEDFKTDPWSVEVSGLVNKPKTFGLEDLISNFDQEERIYRMRCVEGWSMVIPWSGFSLSAILNQVEPTGNAKFVAFETVYRPEEMPGQNGGGFPWPYTEGLRLDEALHSLTTIATGIYGKQLLPQSGAPVRLVVPWKYGFKSIKSIVRITLTDKQPATLWNTVGPNEYGFYSNVNPNRPHPRWSQDTERIIGATGRVPTLMFNGYDKQVAPLYEGMDLIQNY